jgi:hypothetical protein
MALKWPAYCTKFHFPDILGCECVIIEQFGRIGSHSFQLAQTIRGLNQGFLCLLIIRPARELFSFQHYIHFPHESFGVEGIFNSVQGDGRKREILPCGPHPTRLWWLFLPP